jgi:hypothetical protein
VIAGTVYATGRADPSNACLICQPTSSTTAWTSTCPANKTCLSGTCGWMCGPGQTECVENNGVPNLIYTCSPSGTFVQTQACPYVCTSSGSGCTGVCVPSSQSCGPTGIQTCTVGGTWGGTAGCTPCQAQSPGGHGTEYCGICHGAPACLVPQTNPMSITCVCPDGSAPQ